MEMRPVAEFLNEIEKDSCKPFIIKWQTGRQPIIFLLERLWRFPHTQIPKKTKGLDFCFVELRLATDYIELKTFTLKDKR